MRKEIDIRVAPEVAGEPNELKRYVSGHVGIPIQNISFIETLRRSIDARGRQVKFNLKLRVFVDESFIEEQVFLPDYQQVDNAEPVIIVGSGPAGLFAALKLLELGLKPIIIERGKNVKDRIKDLKGINVDHTVNPDSNYCFGEGGAGTYSDGKLYTRSRKRGDVEKILRVLVGFGAVRDILVEAHPHIGTNKLPGIIANIRNAILKHGGEVHFGQRVVDFILESDSIRGVITASGDRFHAKKVILATGHSARDIFRLLNNKKIEIELKPLAIGVRVEHPQSLIDQIQYSCTIDRGPYLPPSSYQVVKQVQGRGVYSFCMCPGGVIAPCATSQDEIVTNGWSSSRRARSTANSGIVVELRPSDFSEFEKFGALAAMEFQRSIEHTAWIAGGRSQTAPAQRLADFINGKTSKSLPRTSYAPGITTVDLKEVLPGFIHSALKSGFRMMGGTMKGFVTNEAIVHAPETRTSSPVRIPRDSATLNHPRIQGLIPCGEGAGYAGGIVSAAIDGEKCALAASL